MGLIWSLRELDLAGLQRDVWPLILPALEGGDAAPIREALRQAAIPAARALAAEKSADIARLANRVVVVRCCDGYLELGNEARLEFYLVAFRALGLKGVCGTLREIQEGHRNLDPRLVAPDGLLGYLRSEELDDLYSEVMGGVELAAAPSWRARTQLKLLMPTESMPREAARRSPFLFVRATLQGLARLLESAARKDRGLALVAS